MSALEVVRDGAVATVTLNRPDRRNALDPALLEALAEAFGELAADAGVRVVVLRGAGPAFCAGADLDWMARESRALPGGERRGRGTDGGRLRGRRRVPEGRRGAGPRRARSAGAPASSRAPTSRSPPRGTTFAFSEVRLGLIPATISPYVLRAIGPGATRALFTTGRRFDADEALRLGPRAPGRLGGTSWTDALAEVVRSLLASGPEAVAACKRLVREATSGLDAGRPAGADRARPHGGGGPRGRHGLPRAAEPVVVRRLLIANRGEIAVRLIRACSRAGDRERRGLHRRASAARWPPRWPTSSRRSPPTSTRRRSSRPAVEAGADADPSRLRVPVRGRRRSRRRRSPPASSGSGRRRRRCARSATRSGRACSPRRPACPSSPARPATTTRSSRRRSSSGPRCSSRPRRAAAGGGCAPSTTLDDLPTAIAAAHREAAAAFGDDRVFLERRLDEARHVEVQILADAHGDVDPPGRARLLAAAPPPEGGRGGARRPRSSADLRDPLGGPRCAIARAAGYVGAGTVEFLLLPDGSFRSSR